MARILLGVSGGIAAYRALDVVRAATRSGHAVRVIQTPDSQRFVGGLSFAALTGAPVLTTEWERDPADRTDASNQTRVSFVGALDTIRDQIAGFVQATAADELIVVAHIYDHAARLRSYELASALLR